MGRAPRRLATRCARGVCPSAARRTPAGPPVAHARVRPLARPGRAARTAGARWSRLRGRTCADGMRGHAARAQVRGRGRRTRRAGVWRGPPSGPERCVARTRPRGARRWPPQVRRQLPGARPLPRAGVRARQRRQRPALGGVLRRSGPATLGEHVRVVRGAVGTKHARCTRAPRCGQGAAFGVAVPSLGPGRSARIRRRECLAARSRPRHIRRGRLRDGEPILRDAVAWAGPWMLHIPAKRGGRPRAGDGGRAARRYRRECLAARSWPRHIPGGRLRDGESIPTDAVACAGVDWVPPYT